MSRLSTRWLLLAVPPAIIVGWLASQDPAMGLTIATFIALLATGLASCRVLAAISLWLTLVLPEGDLLLALGFGLPVGGLRLNIIDGLLLLNLCIFALHLATGRLALPRSHGGFWISALLLVSLGGFLRGLFQFGLKPAFIDVRTFLFFTTYFLAVSLLRSRADLILLARLVMIGLVGHAILVAVFYVFLEVIISPALYRLLFDFENTTGRFGFSNSGLCAILAPFLVVYRRSLGWILPTGMAWPAAGLLVVPLVLSMSRSAIAMMLWTLIVSYLVSVRRDNRAFRIAVKALGASFLVFALISLLAPHVPILTVVFERFGLNSIVESALGRLLSSLYAYQTFLEHPLFGSGFGSQLGLVWITGSLSEKYFVDDAWATTFAKLGLLGGIPLATILVSAFRTGSDLHGRCPEWAKDLLVSLAMSAPAILVSLSLLSAHLVHSRVVVTAFCVTLAIGNRCLLLRKCSGHA